MNGVCVVKGCMRPVAHQMSTKGVCFMFCHVHGTRMSHNGNDMDFSSIVECWSQIGCCYEAFCIDAPEPGGIRCDRTEHEHIVQAGIYEIMESDVERAVSLVAIEKERLATYLPFPDAVYELNNANQKCN